MSYVKWASFVIIVNYQVVSLRPFVRYVLLQVSGGSGSYQWSCDPERVVGVASNGLITAKTKGKSLVVAMDTKNTALSDQTEVRNCSRILSVT